MTLPLQLGIKLYNFLRRCKFLWQNLGYWSLHLLKFRFYKYFVSKFVFGAGSGRSRAFIGGAGAEIFYLEPELKFFWCHFFLPVKKKNFVKKSFFSRIVFFFFKMDNITLDPNPNWAKKSRSGSKFNVFGSTTRMRTMR